MKQSKFTETQIVAILKEAEVGVPVREVCRNHGISSACYGKSMGSDSIDFRVLVNG